MRLSVWSVYALSEFHCLLSLFFPSRVLWTICVHTHIGTSNWTRALRNLHLAFVKYEFHEHSSQPTLWIIVHANASNMEWKIVRDFFPARIVFRLRNKLALSQFRCVRETFWLRKRKIAPNYLWVIHSVSAQFFPTHNSFRLRVEFGVCVCAARPVPT